MLKSLLAAAAVAISSSAVAAPDLACHSAAVQQTLFSRLQAGVGDFAVEGKTVGPDRAAKLFAAAPPVLADIYVARKDADTGAQLCVAKLSFPLARLNRAAFVVPPPATATSLDFDDFSYVVRPSSDGQAAIVQIQEPEQYSAQLGMSVIRGLLKQQGSY